MIIGAFAIVCLSNVAVGLSPSFEWTVIARMAGAMGGRTPR